jgi:hypothetical protein
VVFLFSTTWSEKCFQLGTISNLTSLDCLFLIAPSLSSNVYW